MVPFHCILKPVARLDSQCFSDLPGNGRLSLTCYRGMRHCTIPYSTKYSLLFYYPLLLVAQQGQTVGSLRQPFAERHSSRKLLFQQRTESGGVGERLKPAVLKK